MSVSKSVSATTMTLEASETGSPLKKIQGRSIDSFSFIRPEEAPTFCPTLEEFQDPLVYISKIRPVAEKAGICKIKPPPNWQPPFAVDVDNFKFTPRIQRLNELEAKTRIKLNFLDQIAKFWELQGSSLKIPMIDKKALDLYSLHKLVQKEGGRENLNTDKKWNRISGRLGYANSKQYGPILRSHYEKILYPFDVFQKSKDKLKPSNEETVLSGPTTKTTPVKASSPAKGRMSSKTVPREEDISQETPAKSEKKGKQSAELRRLLFYGAGPKMESHNRHMEHLSEAFGGSLPPQQSYQDPLAKYICQVCRKGDGDDWMLLCDGCDDSYHTYCLSPPLKEVPKGEWRCPQCVAEEVSKPTEAFGFEQAQREYTLQQFGEMADQFKSDYFNMPVHKVSSEMVEREFWRIVSSIDEDVTVEYGADLHTMDHGSGFPTEKSTNVLPADEKYIHSNWNLNNLPVHPCSVLGHIQADISGMKVPWMYVGMCFATFCWHNEDHWSYSINYLHWGEPKTWYGVPGSEADKFEEAMKQAAPELFYSQPDLLHQLVTIMNPNILMDFGVPVYRIDQKAGEFVITFPRAYHAGFNQGYNFAEAVNFAPADWLAMGRECISHYSNLHRYCVFSHDELVCKMSGEPEELDLIIAVAAYRDMVTMFESEKNMRREVLEWGIKKAERVPFELLPDDERLCDFCKTTCFLSAITCSCTKEKLVCLRHYDKLCECLPGSHTLKFRYTLDELTVYLEKLHRRTTEYEEWVQSLTSSFDSPMQKKEKISLEDLKKLVEEAQEKKYPRNSLWDQASAILDDALKCTQIAQSLVAGQVRTRKSESKMKLKVRDLQNFAEQLKLLPVKLSEADMIDNLLQKIDAFQSESANILSQEAPKIDDLKACLAKGLRMDVELPEVKELEMALNRRKWMELVDAADEAEGLWTVDYLDKTIEAGLQLRKDPQSHERIVHLQALKLKLTEWESRAKALLSTKSPSFSVSELDSLIKQSKSMNIALPSLPAVRDLSRKVRDWSNKVKAFENTEEYPYLDTLEELSKRGATFPVHLRQLKIISNQAENAKLWVAKCSKVFLKKNSTVTLAQVLCPRRHADMSPVRGEKIFWKVDSTGSEIGTLLNISTTDLKNSQKLAKAFNDTRLAELNMIRALRNSNSEKKKRDIGSELYCVCRMKNEDYSVRCELCYEWFHATCVPLPKIFDLGEEDGITSLAMVCEKISDGIVKYTCPCCCRSRRPKLETILELLEALQELPVKIFEGEVLTLLVDRAMKWMDDARKLMNQADMMQAYDKIQHRLVAKRNHMKERIDFAEPTGTNIEYCGSDVPPAPVICLPEETLRHLENLLVEGGLMEITFEETAKLWKVYSACNRKLFYVADLEIIRRKIKLEVEVKSANAMKAKRIKSSFSLPSRLLEGSPTKRVNLPVKRKVGENDLNGSPSKKNKVQEYDEDCAAKSCRQPSGKEVNWVQCESECFKWFHLVCVGLKKSDVKKLKRYQCVDCDGSSLSQQPLVSGEGISA